MAASHTTALSILPFQPLILQNPQPSLQNPLPWLPGPAGLREHLSILSHILMYKPL